MIMYKDKTKQNELILNGVVNTDLADVIVLNNEDGTKIVIIKENGNWRVLK